MRLVDAEFLKVLDAVDRLNLWENTIVIFTSDHGEMNGAHRMQQKGNIPFDEATIVNLTVCVPGGPKGQHTTAVGSHLDLAPTLLEFAGLSKEEIDTRYPHLKGHSLKSVILDPSQDGPRGSVNAPGAGALICWDALFMFDYKWDISGALRALTDLPPGTDRKAHMKDAGTKYGAPDFNNRTFFRIVVDGQYKLVRWFNPLEYGNPSTIKDLYATSDVALYDLVNDPGELQNLAHPDNPDHDPALVERMVTKLHALIRD
jgi:arylsulfatase